MQLQVVYTEAFESSRLFWRKALNSTQCKKVTLFATNEQSYRWGTVEAHGADSIKMILAVLWLFSLAYGFETTGLSLKEKIHTKHCHHPKVFLGIFGRNYGEDWTSSIAWYEAPYLKESPKISESLYPVERDRGESRVLLLRSFKTF